MWRVIYHHELTSPTWRPQEANHQVISINKLIMIHFLWRLINSFPPCKKFPLLGVLKLLRFFTSARSRFHCRVYLVVICSWSLLCCWFEPTYSLSHMCQPFLLPIICETTMQRHTARTPWMNNTNTQGVCLLSKWMLGRWCVGSHTNPQPRR